MKRNCNFNPLSNQAVHLFVLSLILICLVLSGCASGGGAGDDSGIAGEQKFIGTFVDDNGTPLSGITVTLLTDGRQADTDSTGTAEISTETLLSGNINIQVDAAWGSTLLTVFGVSTDSRSVVYDVVLSQSSQTASIRSLKITPLSSLSVATSQSCVSCHQVKGDPDCSSNTWLGVHGAFYNCSTGFGGSTSTDSCLSCHSERGSPQCDNSAWRAVHTSYPCNDQSGAQNPGSWQCISCHQDKGLSKCDDATWQNEHKFISCDRSNTNTGQLKCTSCHTLKTEPDCGSSTWIRNHPFWACGDNSSDCTACHTYKGAPKCNDSYWKQVHSTYSCSSSSGELANISCASCHESKIQTKCDDASWRSIHNLFGTGKRIGSTKNLCSSCHDDDRGEANCDDPTWRSFHCFCG